MSEPTGNATQRLPGTLRDHRLAAEAVARGLKARYWAERRFKFYGLAAVSLGMLFLAVLFFSIISKGWSAFRQTYVQLEITYDPALLDSDATSTKEALAQADYNAVVKAAMRKLFPTVEGRPNLRKLYALISSSAGFELQHRLADDPGKLATTERVWLLADDDLDQYYKGRILRSEVESTRPLSDQQLDWADQLRKSGAAQLRFNRQFFTSGDSREPELAGVWGAVAGTFFTLLVTLLLSFPIGVAAAIYLEEFAKKNRMTDLIEVNINNLAAVPSIVFGLLGLAVFINFFGLPRSAPMVGGLVLTLMTLPTIIIASRAALKAVPPSIREAALGMGASKIQMVAHHVLPLALPGMLTGTIIGMARALGESAPLLMIGMVAFIVDIPKGLFDPATVLPVQVFLWSDIPERAFVERTSGAIIVLLAFLIVMNGLAVLLRNRFERRW
ncbi:MAG TPA: phosphate ABC transporter permease PstA [Steroidobacteraceae bacterium]|nr:phosphate ABC transporter permease PstA [Steroidobacteraceae bacterium]